MPQPASAGRPRGLPRNPSPARHASPPRDRRAARTDPDPNPDPTPNARQERIARKIAIEKERLRLLKQLDDFQARLETNPILDPDPNPNPNPSPNPNPNPNPSPSP